jgi:hypothetical protein
MFCVVAPFDQTYEAPGFADNTTLLPLQKVVGPAAEMYDEGNALTLIAVGAEVLVHP